ncbi:hypothetical protein ACFYXF_47885 [Streptomyces sp. NPDC002680]
MKQISFDESPKPRELFTDLSGLGICHVRSVRWSQDRTSSTT